MSLLCTLHRPSKKDRVRVLRSQEGPSEFVGHVGVVIGLDVGGTGECIVKMEGFPDSANMCVTATSCLGKLAQQAV